jgi:predicted small lipoprotein YifL
MKKICAVLLLLALLFTLSACAGKTEQSNPPAQTQPAETQPAQTQPAETQPAETQPAETEPEPAEPEAPAVMSYAEYVAAELDTPVVVETYVQATQSWWDDKITVYSQNEDGAFFIYNMACAEEDAAKLVPGTKLRVSGYKSEWAGEVEIIDATFEIIDGDSFIAPAEDVTGILGSDELIGMQNRRVAFKGMSVEPANGDGDAFLYSWDGSGEEGSDLYFNVSIDGNVYTFTVESYLCGPGTPVYEAVKGLNVGDIVDMEGFLYWYEGVNPHITKVEVK